MSALIDTLVGALVRVIQGGIALSPTLLIGVFVAAVMRYYFGSDGIKRLFGNRGLRSLPQSWLIGMLMPVCSIGVLPVLREMRRSGVSAGAMTAFALSAPLFNPLSLLYGLTLSRPSIIVFFAMGSLLLVTVLGMLWDWISPGEGNSETGKDQFLQEESRQEDIIGIRRLAAMFVQACRELTGPSLAMALIALIGVALLAVVLPFGSMQSSFESDDPWAPLRMVAMGLPVYATPLLTMSQLGMMFQHANSPGAAFALLILGSGVNLATPVWFGRNFGWRPTMVWLAILVVVVTGFAYAINDPLLPRSIQAAGHTHAFDIYSNPIPLGGIDLRMTAENTLRRNVDAISVFAAILLVATMAIGVVLRLIGIDESWLAVSKEASNREGQLASQASVVEAGENGEPKSGGWDIIIPPWVVGAVMLAGLVAFSIVACFAYYPPPDQCLKEAAIARAECLSAAGSGNPEHALYWIPIWKDWSRRLEVGVFIRKGSVRPYQSMQGFLIRKKLDTLEHELAHLTEHDEGDHGHTHNPSDVRALVSDLLIANTRWTAAFRD
ncbi:MAG: permease [Planctomycetota bacterium]